MKYVRWAVVALIGFGISPDASAGGFFGGHGSSGGYASGGGGYAGYGSSGGYASSGGGYSSYSYAGSGGGYASSGGGYASSGGGGLFSRLRAHMAAKRAAHASSGGSSGGYSYSSYYGASSGGSSGGYSSYYGASSYGASSGGSSGGYSSAYGGSVGGYNSYGTGYSAGYGGSYGSGYGGSYGSTHSAVPYASPAYTTPAYGAGYGAPMAPTTGFVSPYSSSSVAPAMSYPMASAAPAGLNSVASSSQSQIDAQVVDGDYSVGKPAMDDDAALLTVAVPVESAVVTVNGHETTSDGLVRQFMSRGLKDGYLYTYEVVVQYEVDGQPRTDKRTIKLRPGDMERIVFSEIDEEADIEDADLGDVPATSKPETVVRLHVPADARVTLAGNPTNGQGETRTYRTQQLAAGQSWDDYTVEVVADINGRTMVRRQTLTVSAGQEVDLNFDFTSSDLAMN